MTEESKKDDQSAYHLDNLIGGTARLQALELFLKACNKRDTLFITDVWITPRLEQLKKLLSDPITEEQAIGLKNAVLKRIKIDDLIQWLNDQRP